MLDAAPGVVTRLYLALQGRPEIKDPQSWQSVSICCDVGRKGALSRDGDLRISWSGSLAFSFLPVSASQPTDCLSYDQSRAQTSLQTKIFANA
jgi:hypothetical protein